VLHYLLDTDTLIYFRKGYPSVVERMLAIPAENLHTSDINRAELLYGAYVSTHKERNLRELEQFLTPLTVLPFAGNAVRIFAEQKAMLRKSGTLISDLDLMIASIAMDYDMPLVTNNKRHFDRVKGLVVENWVAS